MSTRTQQLFKSAQRKLDKVLETRVRLARELRHKRMGLNEARKHYGSGCTRCGSNDYCRCAEAYS